ncbi:hypothetical protein A6769_10325 [Nostoc punctiforme NIES-2108]|uniref:ORC1/DEAH AAA+ ATPase domain-containing protein n=1 Tax=Nostoc punctiforme NIES-2108 TaxID=1356359 RepID=A0A367RNL4_NOSPU|nr:hypothetical protein A6769_10325 [Nostoc punctiforme NIES-2108]
MTTLDAFPLELLTQPATERLAYFENKTVAHPRLQEVNEILMRTIAEPAGASFIFVYGPSGIGKTTLRLRAEEKLTELALPKLESDRAHVPVIGIEAIAPESRYFNWKEYYTRALIALEEPLIDHKFDYGVRGISRNNFGKINVESKVVAPALRRALENALIHRHPDVFFVDEAQHFGKVASGYKLQDQLDCLKSLANMTGILHCLLGTYELLTFRNLSGQLSRRSVDIHFRRYCADSPEDVQAFKSVLLTFQQHMPLAETPNLVDHWEYFYERTLGCVGIVKDWLMRALKDALDREATTITLKDLQKRALSVAQCQKIFKDIQEGELQLSETEAHVQDLRSALGLGAKPIVLPEETPKTTRPPKKVAKRKPKRDPIGVQQDVS